MFFKTCVLLLIIVHKLGVSDCVEDEWELYESRFKNHNREEIIISNVTTDPNFNSNFTVEKWKVLNIGTACYNGGITNNTMLVILFSTLSSNGSIIAVNSKAFELNYVVSEVEFFQDRKSINQTVYAILYNPERGELIWYSIIGNTLNKVWIWIIEGPVTYFNFFTMDNKNFLLANIGGSDTGANSLIIYGFNSATMEHWYYQSIPLASASSSSCVSTIIGTNAVYLSIAQPASNKLLIYQFFDRHFIPFNTLNSPEIDQVVCFENGFKSFIAFNGLNAGVYEFTPEGLEEQEIVNSNLKTIKLWLPIPVNTYRDETLLLYQRKLDHGTHAAFDVDIVTYNGNRFEDHVDVPCTLFGEHQNGLKCLTEYNSKAGILGSSYIAVGNHLALIVPRFNDTSTLFHLEIGIRKIEHPAKKELEEFLKLKIHLQAIIDEQKEAFSELAKKEKTVLQDTPKLRTASAKSNGGAHSKFFKLNSQAEDIIQEIEKLNTDLSPVPGGKYGTIIFNGPVEILQDLTTETVEIEDEELSNLLKDIVRKDHLLPIPSFKTFNNLTADEITFGIVNGVSKDEFITANGGRVEVVGNIGFKQRVEVQTVVLAEGRVNDFEIDGWVTVDGDLEKDTLIFDELVARDNFEADLLNGQNFGKYSTDVLSNLESLTIPGNVTVNTLNGHDFESFLGNLCVNHIKCHIPNLKLLGSMNVQANADIEHLNDLKFPEEYVGLDPKEKLVITGAKLFNNITRGYKVTTEGTINKLNPSKIVKLSGEQNITGTLTFDNLEVVSGLNVNGKLKGKGIERLMPNIGLKETNNITSNVEFNNLEVFGDIIITDNFNGTRFDEYLNNIVLKNENATITGSKTFPQGFTVLNNLHIKSNSINNISLDYIITKDTNQDLLLDSLIGNVVDFDHLYVQGFFDGQNVTELNKNLLKLTGANHSSSVDSELVFLDDVLVDTLIVDELDMEYLNGEYLDVESVLVEGNIVGNIANFSPKDLEDNYLNYMKDQVISAPYFIDKLTSSEVKAKYINNVPFDDLLSYQKIWDNITDILTYRNATVDTINVEGNLNVTRVNEEDFQEMLDNHPWVKLHRNSSRLTIDGDVYFESLEIQKLGNTLFEPYVNKLVFKNETDDDIEIRDSVIFENGIIVKKLIETTTLNDVALENILRKFGNQTIVGPISILGDVTIDDDVTVKGMINNVAVTYMFEEFDIGEDSLKVKGEVMFERLPYIRNLTIHGLINEKDFNKLKSTFVYTNGDLNLEKGILFKEAVHIIGNLGISNDINGIVLSEFVPRIVWLTQDANIAGPVKFIRSVDCFKSLNVETAINTKSLFGNDLEERIKEGVLLNQGLMEGTFHFENITINDELLTTSLNNINMDTIIPLKTPQQIDELHIGEMLITHDFNVESGCYVNGVNLMVERDRTMLGNVEQHVASEIVFMNNVLVEDNLKTLAINGKPMSKIVSTNTDQNLTAAYHFSSKCHVDEHFLVDGLINDVNLTSWKNTALPIHSARTQHINQKWTVMENLNLVGPLNGAGLVNDMNITKLVKDIQERDSYLCDIEKGIAEDFSNMCKDVTYIYKNAQDQIYKFKYFEELQTLSLSNHVNYLKHFEHQGRHYLLVNEKGSCVSDLLIFGQKGGFFKTKSVSSGGILQVETVKSKNDLFLVSRGLDVDDLVCDIRFSTIVWKWIDDELQIVASTKAQELLQESQIPLTFYGLRQGVVTEFKINPFKEIALYEYRKWDIKEDNAAFIPRGLQIGLALRTGKHTISLHQTAPIIDEEYGLEVEGVINDNFTKLWNNVIPGKRGGDVAVVNVGVKGTRKALLAVASHKRTQVEHRLDIIEIYLDPFKGELFDQILTYRPTGLTSVEFGNGETLLAFMEDKKVLQIYEYKGIEGFKHRSSIKIQADQIVLMDLPIEYQLRKAKVLGLVHKSKITLLQAFMVGTKIRDGLQCDV